MKLLLGILIGFVLFVLFVIIRAMIVITNQGKRYNTDYIKHNKL